MGKKQQKPSDPAEAARRRAAERERQRDPANWGVNEDALKLVANRSVNSEDETRTKTRRVERFDCFATLSLTDAQLTGVRRYQDDLAVRFGCDGGGQRTEHVDGSGCADLVSARSLDAGARLDDVKRRMEPWMGILIDALSIPTHVEGHRVNWHAVVKTRLGLTDRQAQSKAVKRMTEGLRMAWISYDNRLRKAA